jgi:predicted ATPase
VPGACLEGREAELAQLTQWYETAQQGQRQVGLIGGEPGIGKTALVDAFVAQVAAKAPVWIAHGQCMDRYGAGEPYLPVLEGLGRLCRGPDGKAIVAVLHQVVPSWLLHLPMAVGPSYPSASASAASAWDSPHVIAISRYSAIAVCSAARACSLGGFSP